MCVCMYNNILYIYIYIYIYKYICIEERALLIYGPRNIFFSPFRHTKQPFDPEIVATF